MYGFLHGQFSAPPPPPPALKASTDSNLFKLNCNSGTDLVVALEYTFFQRCSYAEQISARSARFRRSYVKRPAVVLTSHTNYIALLLDVLCGV